LLTAHGKVAAMNRFFIAGICLNAGLNLFLIPRWQAFGAAIAAVATQGFIAASMIWLVLRTFHWRPSARAVLEVVGYLVFILLINFLIAEETTFRWYVKMALSAAACLPGLLLFGWIKWASLRELKTG
jgi:O-antigen/teichoic acid export membrane protein